MPNKSKQDDPEQSKRFIEAAKEAQAHDDEKSAERAFKKIVKPPKGYSRSASPK